MRYRQETWREEFFNVTHIQRGRRVVSYWNPGKIIIAKKHSHRTTLLIVLFPSKQQFRHVAQRALEDKAAPSLLARPYPETPHPRHTPSAAPRKQARTPALFTSQSKQFIPLAVSEGARFRQTKLPSHHLASSVDKNRAPLPSGLHSKNFQQKTV